MRFKRFNVRKAALWAGLILLIFSFFGPACGSTDNGRPEAIGLTDDIPVTLTAEVDRAEATVIDPFTMSITLEADPEVSISIPDIGPEIKGLRIIDMGSHGPKRRDGRIWRQRWYRLQADLTGSYLLPACKIPYTAPGGKEEVAETAQIFVEIKTVLEDETEGQDIKPLKPIEEMKRPLPLPWILSGLGGLILLGIIVGFLLYLQRRNKDIEKHLSPEELSQRELRHLETTGLLEEERYREYVFGLSLIFRRYLERKFELPAAEQTTEEILASLRKHQILDNTLKDMARNFLEETDPIKYRGIAPQGEETTHWRTKLISFIDQAARPAGETLKEAL